MKVLVTGAEGQLGHAVVDALKQHGHEVIGTDIDTMDITNIVDVTEVVTSVNPNVIIHCAAWTDVETAEDNESDVYNINVNGTRNIIDICAVLDCTLLFISSDYVFEDDGSIKPHLENEMCHPVSVYGRSKLDGEQLVLTSCLEKFFIIRVSWLFGPNGHNFVKTMLNLSDVVDHVRVINDQIGRPTYTIDLSRLICDIIVTDKYGIYNVSNEGEYISWADFAREIFKTARKSVEVIPIPSDQYRSTAKRPKNSRLDTTKLIRSGFNPLADWKDALIRYLGGEL